VERDEEREREKMKNLGRFLLWVCGGRNNRLRKKKKKEINKESGCGIVHVDDTGFGG